MIGRSRSEQKTRRHSTFSAKPIEKLVSMKKHSISMPNVAADYLVEVNEKVTNLKLKKN